MKELAPIITSLKPVVLPDNRRVTMELVVDNLPSVFGEPSGINLYETPPTSKSPLSAEEIPDAEFGSQHERRQSKFPDIELSIIDSNRQEIASLLIIEHKEPFTSLTLHLRSPQSDELYTARAEMTYNNETLGIVEVPFTLEPVN